MKRIVGIDLGERHIGVAAADDRLNVAIPVETVEASGDLVSDVVRIAESQRADELVIGLPLSLTGAAGPQARAVLRVVDEVRGRVQIPVHTWDERLSTAEARHRVGPGRRSAAWPGRDAMAAAVMLQACLDARRSGAR